MSLENYERWKICTYKYWAVYLHAECPCYLGRTYIWLLREGVVDIMDTTPEEQAEFIEIGRELKKVITNLFGAEHFNWAALGNITAHCHVHVIPRYSEQKIFDNVVFRDERWGKNYAPCDREFMVSDQTLSRMKELIASRLR